MPTPVIYTGANARPVFDEVSEARRSPVLDLLYFTNRVPEADPNGGLSYGAERSKSLAFGSVRIDVGSEFDWDRLEEASQDTRRRIRVEIKLTDTTELGRYPSSPYHMHQVASGFRTDPAFMAKHLEAEQALKTELDHLRIG